MPSLRTTLKKDDAFRDLKLVVAAASRGFDEEAILNEAKTLHMSRKTRNLRTVTMAPTPLYEAATNDMANRSRLVEIRVSLMHLCSTVEDATKTFRQMVLSNHSEALNSEARTQMAKNAFLDDFLGPAVNLRRTLESIIEVLDVYIKDIDQTGFGLRLATDVLTLAHGRRGQAEA